MSVTTVAQSSLRGCSNPCCNAGPGSAELGSGERPWSDELADLIDAGVVEVPEDREAPGGLRCVDEFELLDDAIDYRMSRVDVLEWELWAGADQDEAEKTLLELKAPAWAFLPPGADLAAALEQVRPQTESPIALIELMKATTRLTSWSQATTLSAMASFYRQRQAQASEFPRPSQIDSHGRPIDPERSWMAEIAAALKLSPETVASHVGTALRLTSVLQATHTALRCGAITLSKAIAICDATRPLTDAQARAVEAHVLKRAASQSHQNLRKSLRTQVAHYDAKNEADRHRAAKADREVRMIPLPDGMAALWIVHTAEKIQQMWIVIQAMADLAKRPTGTPTQTAAPAQTAARTQAASPTAEDRAHTSSSPNQPPHDQSRHNQPTPATNNNGDRDDNGNHDRDGSTTGNGDGSTTGNGDGSTHLESTAVTREPPTCNPPATSPPTSPTPGQGADNEPTSAATTTPAGAPHHNPAEDGTTHTPQDHSAPAPRENSARNPQEHPGQKNSSQAPRQNSPHALQENSAHVPQQHPAREDSAHAPQQHPARENSAHAPQQHAAREDSPQVSRESSVQDTLASKDTAGTGSAEHKRTVGQRRADVTVDLFEHILHNGLDWLGRRLPDQHRRRPHIEVLIPIGTLLGLDDEPCQLTGYGPIPAEQARHIAADGTWRRLLTDPTNGAILEASTTRHDPAALVSETLLAAHPTCDWINCNRQARQCDRDHGTPFTRTGTTTLADLRTYCEYHHIIKDTPTWGWKATNNPDGSTTLTTPTGHRYTTIPPRPGPISTPPNTNPPDNDPPPF